MIGKKNIADPTYCGIRCYAKHFEGIWLCIDAAAARLDRLFDGLDDFEEALTAELRYAEGEKERGLA